MTERKFNHGKEYVCEWCPLKREKANLIADLQIVEKRRDKLIAALEAAEKFRGFALKLVEGDEDELKNLDYWAEEFLHAYSVLAGVTEVQLKLEAAELKKVDAVADRVNAENECCVLRGNLEAKDKRIEVLEDLLTRAKKVFVIDLNEEEAIRHRGWTVKLYEEIEQALGKAGLNEQKRI